MLELSLPAAKPAATAMTFVGAGLLVLAGMAKVPRPDGAMATLHRLKLPSGRIAARLLGAAEVAVGLLIIGLGGLWASILLLAAYGTFAMVSAWQRRRQLSCGCFGTSDTAVTGLHVGLNIAFAATGAIGLVVVPAPASAVAADVGPIGAIAGLVLLMTAVLLLRLWLVSTAQAILRRRPLTSPRLRADLTTEGSS